ncbi:hypothetical protein [Planomonospora alba]
MTESIPPAGSFRFLPDPWPSAGAGAWADDLEESLVALAGEAGFRPSHTTRSELELVHPGRRLVIYINRKRLRRKTMAVIVPPWSELDGLCAVPGVNFRGGFFHSSNMRTFPRHVHGGREEIPYGYSMECADQTAFSRLLVQIP